MIISELNKAEIARILSEQALGRLGCIAESEPYVVPVTFYFDGTDIFIHSLPGKKIDALRKTGKGCLQVDEIHDSFNWRSVLVFGNYEEISDERVREEKMAEIFKRRPEMTPVESSLMERYRKTIVFCLRTYRMTGIGESW
jgi:nitroimidazol reductase NimA-like FMN-containing flavoprotein (pyridoxamine 5'-phosphate oxidase superfamily)